MNAFRSSIDWSVHAQALVLTLVVPVNSTRVPPVVLHETEEAKAFDPQHQQQQHQQLHLQHSTQDGSAPTTMNRVVMGNNRVGPSPYPFLDRYVNGTLGSRGGVCGSVRAWNIAYETPTTDCDEPKFYNNNNKNNNNSGAAVSITYQLCRNRWCENIGRPHKSNNIMWTIDFRTLQCTQSCHDPDCRASGFRGKPIPLPNDTADELEDALFEARLASIDEDALLRTRKPLMFDTPAGPTSVDLPLSSQHDVETALLALRIEGDTPKKSNVALRTESSVTESRPNSNTAIHIVADDSQDTNCTHSDKTSDCETSFLDDDALLGAVMANPDLFP